MYIQLIQYSWTSQQSNMLKHSDLKYHKSSNVIHQQYLTLTAALSRWQYTINTTESISMAKQSTIGHKILKIAI